MAGLTQKTPKSQLGDPPWEIAQIFPEQGSWDGSDLFALPNNRSVELNDGMIEILPSPKKSHEITVSFLAERVRAYVAPRTLGGTVFRSGYKLKTGHRHYREPDVMYLTAEQDRRAGEDFTAEAELVLAVVSPEDPDRDYVTKRKEYALAGIPEYWIVDRDEGQILVLRLENGAYIEHGCFVAGQQATSFRFPGLTVSMDDMLKVGR